MANKYIDFKNVRSTALTLYIYGEKKTRICKKLSIYMTELDKWIKEMNQPKKQKIKTKTKRNSKSDMKIPNNYSGWVSDICKNTKNTAK